MTTYYVDVNSGSDSNNGLSAIAAFKTIAKACNLVIPGDVVNIAGGVYRETIRPARGGVEGSPIVFRGYGDREAIVSGCEIVSGPWTAHSNGIQKCQLPPSWPIGVENFLVFANGQMLMPAMWPKSNKPLWNWELTDYAESDNGYYNSTPIDTSGNYLGYYEDTNLKESFWADGYINFYPGKGWGIQTGKIVHSSAGKIGYNFPLRTTSGAYYPTKGNYYYLWGKLEALTQEGECFVDANKVLYVLLSELKSKTVEIQVRDRGVDLSSRPYITIENISLFGCRIAGGNANGICLRQVKLEYAYHSFSGLQAAININGDCEIINCTVDKCSGNGITAQGNQLKLQNNVVYRTGYLSAGVAIGIGNTSPGAIVDSNTVYITGAHGISAGSPGGKFTRNRVAKAAMRCIDISGINVGGTGDMKNAEISYNIVHDILAISDPSREYNASMGIRYDCGFPEGVSNLSIHHNLIWNTSGPSIAFWPLASTHTNFGKANNKIFNNTVQSTIASPSRTGSSFAGIAIQNNIASELIINGAAISPDLVLKKNIFPYISYPENLKLDPGLVNPESFDYRLRPKSPAINAGVLIGDFTPYSGSAPDIGAIEFGSKPLIAGAYIFSEHLKNLSAKQHSESKNQVVISGFPLGRGLPPSAVLVVNGVTCEYFYNTLDPDTGVVEAIAVFPISVQGVLEVYLDSDRTVSAKLNIAAASSKSPSISSVSASLDGSNYRLIISGSNFPNQKTLRMPLVPSGVPTPFLKYDRSQISSFGRLGFICNKVGDLLPNFIQQGYLSANLNGFRIIDEDGNQFKYWLDGEGGSKQILWACVASDPFSKIQHYSDKSLPASLYLEMGNKDWTYASSPTNVFPHLTPQFWLRSQDINDVTDGQPVPSWKLFNSTRTASQSDIAKTPKFRVNSLNGFPSLEFDGVDDYYIVGDISSEPGVGTFWVVYANPTEGNQYQRLLSAAIPGTKESDTGLLMPPAIDNATQKPVLHLQGNIVSTIVSTAKNIWSNLHVGTSQSSLKTVFKGHLLEAIGLPAALDFKSRDLLSEFYLKPKYGMSSGAFQAELQPSGIKHSVSVLVEGIPAEVVSTGSSQIEAIISNAFLPSDFKVTVSTYYGTTEVIANKSF